MTIQIDMFEVGLGSAVLLQFATEGGVVRVLADAGATSYPPDHVYKRLPGKFVGPASAHVDLIVGTHYDADHLEGFVPIINDRSISISEAWLPPVANDTESVAVEDRPLDGRLLALQFAGEDGHDVFVRYLHAKEVLCDELAAAERSADEWRDDIPQRDLQVLRMPSDASSDDIVGIALEKFQRHIRDANITLGSRDEGHADQDVLVPDFRLVRPYGNWWPKVNTPSELARSWGDRRGRARVEAQSLAFIRRSAARDAINAVSLNKVVTALKARKIPIRCATIEDGKPRRFVWSERSKRFTTFQNAVGRSPELLLLAPSEGLVKKHWKRLPIGDYLHRVALTALPVKSITPSNELSYVIRFSFSGQNILITGDAGFVDFKIGRSRSYHQSLLDSLDSLQVVQVAHHGGANAHFYNGLLASKFPNEIGKSYLLLSHGVNDKHRPSELFSKFVELVRKDDGGVRVLFTSQPQEKFARDFRDLIEPVVGTPQADRGDVQLRYERKNWNVTRHAVKV